MKIISYKLYLFSQNPISLHSGSRGKRGLSLGPLELLRRLKSYRFASFIINPFSWTTFFQFFFQVDPYHTLFGLTGLSLLGSEEVKEINPVYCLPQDIINRLKSQPEILD
jgi:hypothetical protein